MTFVDILIERELDRKANDYLVKYNGDCLSDVTRELIRAAFKAGSVTDDQ